MVTAIILGSHCVMPDIFPLMISCQSMMAVGNKCAQCSFFMMTSFMMFCSLEVMLGSQFMMESCLLVVIDTLLISFRNYSDRFWFPN